MRMRQPSVFVWVLLLMMAAPAAAQLTTGTISGTVIDQTRASLPGAEVTITNVGTGLVRTVFANDNGRFEAPNLPIGPYEVTAALSGFGTGGVGGPLSPGGSGGGDSPSSSLSSTGPVTLVPPLPSDSAAALRVASVAELPPGCGVLPPVTSPSGHRSWKNRAPPSSIPTSSSSGSCGSGAIQRTCEVQGRGGKLARTKPIRLRATFKGDAVELFGGRRRGSGRGCRRDSPRAACATGR